MVPLLWVVFGSYIVVTVSAYLYLYKSRMLIGYHLGMNMATASGGILGLSNGIILGYLFPFSFSEVTIVNALIAAFIGAVFGALIDYNMLVAGLMSGIMSGMMGPMIIVMANNPLPLLAFSTLLVYVCFGLLCFSIRS